MNNTTNNNEVFNQLFETFAAAITKKVLEQVEAKIDSVIAMSLDDIDVDDKVARAIEDADITSQVDDAINEKDMSELIDIDEVIYQLERKMDIENQVEEAIGNTLDAKIDERIKDAISKLRFNASVSVA